VVLPLGSNPLKVRSIKQTGAELIEHGKDFEEAGGRVAELVEERGLYFVHPANEPEIVHGVATEFCEILEEVPDLDVLLIPLGAGSEAAAALTVIRAIRPEVEVIAVQAEAASSAWRSWKEGRQIEAPNTTFAGGVATGRSYELPYSIYKDGLDDFLLLSEEELYEGIALAAYHTRNLAEGAGGACLRAAIKIRDRLKGKKVAIQMSGGNAAPEELRKAFSLPCLENGIV
jgi:threonine dehydratase